MLILSQNGEKIFNLFKFDRIFVRADGAICLDDKCTVMGEYKSVAAAKKVLPMIADYWSEIMSLRMVGLDAGRSGIGTFVEPFKMPQKDEVT